MAKGKIIWSQTARIKLYQILDFYIERNQSKTYSSKLLQKINKELKTLLKQPDIGIKTEVESVRGLIIEHYIFYYELQNKNIIIYTIWDCRQNPNDLIIK